MEDPPRFLVYGQEPPHKKRMRRDVPHGYGLFGQKVPSLALRCLVYPLYGFLQTDEVFRPIGVTNPIVTLFSFLREVIHRGQLSLQSLPKETDIRIDVIPVVVTKGTELGQLLPQFFVEVNCFLDLFFCRFHIRIH